MTKKAQADRDEAIAKLREWIKPGDTVYTILDHVSRSGMQRRIRVVLLKNSGEGAAPVDLHPNWLVSKALGWRQASGRGQGDGLVVDGCGMDMGFQLVYVLSATIYHEYECLGKDCHSPDHHGRRNADPDKRGAGITHKDGYALAQRWL